MDRMLIRNLKNKKMKTMQSFKSVIARKNRLLFNIVLFSSISFSANCFAQQISKDVDGQAKNQKPEKVSLEMFQGFYQFPNKVAFIQFELEDNFLSATQIWDDKKYQLTRRDETNFESKIEGHKIEFLKENSGQFSHAKILGRIMLTKVAYDPRKIKQLSETQLKKLEGTYFLKDDHSRKLQIRTSLSGLSLIQLWDNKEITFSARSESFFLDEDGRFPLTFLLSGGEAIQVTCFEDDVWLKEK